MVLPSLSGSCSIVRVLLSMSSKSVQAKCHLQKYYDLLNFVHARCMPFEVCVCNMAWNLCMQCYLKLNCACNALKHTSSFKTAVSCTDMHSFFVNLLIIVLEVLVVWEVPERAQSVECGLLTGAGQNGAPADVSDVQSDDHIVTTWNIVGKTQERVVRKSHTKTKQRNSLLYPV